jgi:hypothetical protein
LKHLLEIKASRTQQQQLLAIMLKLDSVIACQKIKTKQAGFYFRAAVPNENFCLKWKFSLVPRAIESFGIKGYWLYWHNPSSCNRYDWIKTMRSIKAAGRNRI